MSPPQQRSRSLLRTARLFVNLPPCLHAPARRFNSTIADQPPWFTQIRDEMLSRPARSSREYIEMNTDHKLVDSFATFLPREWRIRMRGNRVVVPMGHHLAWFNPAMVADKLLPDGTDPLDCPGGPWTRRMWAGGSLQLKPDLYYSTAKGFIGNSNMACAEYIRDVQLRGQGDAAKIFVTVERRFARLDVLQEKSDAVKAKTGEYVGPRPVFRQQLQDQDWGDAIFKEQRTLVFLKERSSGELAASQVGQLADIKYLEPPGKPEFSHTLTPDRTLLFRYSALTFNAHLIHLDREYARNVEGHRNLLVHGPLSLTLMLQAVAGHVAFSTNGKHVLDSVQYRNLAPLYCDEQMRLCGMMKKESPTGNVYDVWIEGPTGGVAVKGTVHTVVKPDDNSWDATGQTPARPAIKLIPAQSDPHLQSKDLYPGEKDNARSRYRREGVRLVDGVRVRKMNSVKPFRKYWNANDYK